MKTKYRHVHFHKLAPSRPTWACHRNNTEETIGFLEKYELSRGWYFDITTGKTWSVHEVKRYINYLRDLADFMEQLNKEGKPK
jgi:hypothetical protein